MENERKKTVTLKDIAERAGVSVAAVSKALQNKSDIGQDTIERVQSIARMMGYRPNAIAKSLRTGQTKVLGVLIPDNCNPYNALVIKGIEETAKENGYIVLVANTEENPESEREVLQSMISMKVAGILTIPISLENYKFLTLPLIFMSRYPYRGPYKEEAKKTLGEKRNFIVNDDYVGEYLATEHLIQRGFHNIYLITGSSNIRTVEGIMNLTRLEGYRQALKDYGLAFSEEKICFGISNIRDSYTSVMKITEAEKEPFALCMNSDYSAIGAISALCERGKLIPEKAAVVGYDDIEMARYLSIPLTTINQKKYTIGMESAKHLIYQIEGKTTEIEQKILKPTLVIRQTT